jgi:CheY-like chemotaxis protein
VADQPSVLIVDSSEDTREVLQTALARRGMRTYFASRATQGLDLARRLRPDLIVLDLELEDCEEGEGWDWVGAAAEDGEVPGHPRLVLLGTARRNSAHWPPSEFLPKPYHYAVLVRKIEELLTVSPQSCAGGR